MTLSEVLQVGSRLFKYLGSPAGQMAIYPQRAPGGDWVLLVKFDAALALVDMPLTFEGVLVQYERY